MKLINEQDMVIKKNGDITTLNTLIADVSGPIEFRENDDGALQWKKRSEPDTDWRNV